MSVHGRTVNHPEAHAEPAAAAPPVPQQGRPPVERPLPPPPPPAQGRPGRRRLVLAIPVVVGTVGWLLTVPAGTGGPVLAVVAVANLLAIAGAVTLALADSAGLRRQLAQALREARSSHNQLQALIDNTSANIYMKRIDTGRYLLVNREWERLFKVDREQVIDLTDHGVFPPGLADQLRANDLAVAASGHPVQFEESAETDDGLHTYVSVKFPVLDSTGEPYAVCGISTDITDRKRAEEEVRRLNADLERRVLERTAELEASTRELDAFAYSVSHDLRAPLRSLYGFSEALLEDYDHVLDEGGRDCLHRLQRNVQRMGQMIDDLLNLSRATRVDLSRGRVDITAQCQEIAAELAAGDPDREVTMDIASGLQDSGDPHLIHLALHNLLENAWKFTGKQERPVIVVGQTERDGERLFFVRDNGAGFDMRYADKLFTTFHRLHPAADFEGTGIGLAIVHRILRRHGGRVFAESVPDQGATFYFTLRSEAMESEARKAR